LDSERLACACPDPLSHPRTPKKERTNPGSGLLARDRLSMNQLVLTAILALSLLLRLPFISVPLERDEGEYAYIAWLMQEGGLPYKDAFDQKPPGVFFIYLLIMKLFGFSIEGIHLGMYLWSLGAITLVYLTGCRLFSPRVGLLAAGIFSVASISPAFLGMAANTEIFMTLPLTAAAYFACGFAMRLPRGNLTPFLCGLMVGLASTFKQVAATDGVFFALVMVLVTLLAGGGIESLCARGVAFALGVVTPWIPILAFFQLGGGIRELLQDALLLGLSYSNIVPLASYVDNFFLTSRTSLIPYLWPYLVMASLGVWMSLTRKARERTTWWFLPGWLLASFLGTCIGGMFREHYFIQTLAPLSLLAGFFLAAATQRIASAPWRFGACTAGVVLPLLLGFRPFFTYSPDEVSRVIYEGNPFVESKEVAEVVRENTAQGDRVLIFGSEPQILFYARRRSASRYIVTYPLMMSVAGAAERQVEMFNEILASNPPLIVTVNVRVLHLYGPWTSKYLFQKLAALIAQDYVRIYPTVSHTVGVPAIEIYKRRAGAAAAASSGVAGKISTTLDTSRETSLRLASFAIGLMG
jgi:hypothetical protein